MSRRETSSRLAAIGAVSRAIARGVLAKAEACERCGATAADGVRLHHHHWSYLRKHWLDVIPLCVGCHGKVHSGEVPEPRTGRFRRRPPESIPTDGDVADYLGL